MNKFITLSILTIGIVALAGCTRQEQVINTQPETEPLYTQESWKTMIPETCESFFDGCNNCQRIENVDGVACTKMFCAQYAMPACLDEADGDNQTEPLYTQESWKTMIPETCESFFDGCNNCHRTENSDDIACTLMYCEEFQQPSCLDAQDEQG